MKRRVSKRSVKQAGSGKSRQEKLEAIRKQRIQPYGGAFPKTGTIQSLAADYVEGRHVATAGRLTARRGHGGLTFADLKDYSGKIQLCLKRDIVGDSTCRLLDYLDIGDIIGATGTLFKTKAGEVTVQVNTLTVLSKALRPLPEKWHGLKDVEIRYRRRYLDLIANASIRDVFAKRSRVVTSLRSTLERHAFMEVDTPIMHPIPGGAAGEPFVTHHKALDTVLYLRLAPELYLKQLLVGGLERVYELGRSFRNEGLSTQHNPEFTMLESYAAYQDYTFMMELVQDLVCDAANALYGTLKISFRSQTIDLTPPWERVSFADGMEDMGAPRDVPLEKIQDILRKKGIVVKGLARSQLVRLVEQLFIPKAKGRPLFVVDYWVELSPLAKSKPDDPRIAERFELFIGGMEVANAYSELNDPIEQRRRFEAQHKAGSGRAPNIDEAFLEALEHGMPPAAGLGVGIDRLAMLLLDQPSIKDVLLFPLLKPERR